jgi:NAD(P)-dependent dehydrogenase (short-subunit alcohol dehydrogenase family)
MGVVQPLSIVITGVTRGLGRAMVDEFVRLGHKVSGCGRTEAHIEALARSHPGHHFQKVDVASDAAVMAWANDLLEKHGPPDFVLNNAAVINEKASLCDVRERDFSEVIDINIKGVVHVVRHFVPAMIRRQRGVIVNFSSRWGHKVEKQMAPYCATKWAVIALTRALAAELRPEGVAAVALNPGIVKTGMLERYLGHASNPDVTTCLTPQQWANRAVPFILSFGLKDTGKIRNLFHPIDPRVALATPFQRDSP